MGVVLRGRQGQFVFNNTGWAMLLRLAWDYGWRPLGTSPPAHWELEATPRSVEEWNPADYVTCRGQRVSDRDAALLAEALAALVEDLPPTDPIEDQDVARIEMPGYPPNSFVSATRTVNAFEALGGSNREGFRLFLSFCREGGFEIW